jgi:enoyl-CoA hydratase/carnithine racemase
MSGKDLVVKEEKGVGRIIFNRPEVLNAYNEYIARGLVDALDQLRRSDGVRVILISGTGRAFMAGADISMLTKWLDSGIGEEGVTKILDEFFSPSMIEKCPKPVIAAVNGIAYGEGCEIAMACDIRIASERARFGQPEINIGVIPGAGGTQRLCRLVGLGKGMELLFTGESIDANQAHELGLVNQVVPDAEFSAVVDRICQNLCKKSQIAISHCKRSVLEGLAMTSDRAIAHERELFISTLFSEDAREGLTAFLEKRKPSFR